MAVLCSALRGISFGDWCECRPSGRHSANANSLGTSSHAKQVRSQRKRILKKVIRFWIPRLPLFFFFPIIPASVLSPEDALLIIIPLDEEQAPPDEAMTSTTSESSAARRGSMLLTNPAPLFSPDDVYIAVMGVTGSGKSTFISKLCPTAVAGHNLVSGKCTSNHIGNRAVFLTLRG